MEPNENKNSLVIQWPEKGRDPRQSGRYPSFAYFQSCTPGGVVNEYHRGNHVLVRVTPDMPVMVVEILHIWRETKKALGETGGSVRMKLYTRPEDTSSGRNYHHGEHELLLFHKTIVVTCEQLVRMEVRDMDWTIGLPLHPPKGLTPSPPPWEASSNGTSLLCRERMTPIGIFESEDQIGASPTSSPVPLRNNTSLPCCKLLVVSIERYNRHCAVFRRLGQFAYDMMDQPLVQAMGGIPSPKEPTMLAFCRKTFRDGMLEKTIMGAEGVVNSISIMATKRLVVEQAFSGPVAKKPPSNKMTATSVCNHSQSSPNSVVPVKRRGGWPKGKPRKKKIDGPQKPAEQEKPQPGRRGRPRKIRHVSPHLEKSVASSNPDVTTVTSLHPNRLSPVVRRGRPPKHLKFTNIIGMPPPRSTQSSKLEVIKTASTSTKAASTSTKAASTSTKAASPKPSDFIPPLIPDVGSGSVSDGAPIITSEPFSHSESVIKTSKVTSVVPSHSTPSSSSYGSPGRRGRPIKHQDFSHILSLPPDQISPVVRIGRPPKYEESDSSLSVSNESVHVTTSAPLLSQHTEPVVGSASTQSVRAMLSPTRDLVSRSSIETTASPSISSLVTLLQNAWRSPSVPNSILLPKLASTISSMHVPGPASSALPANPMANQINQLAILSQLIMQSAQKVAQATASINAMANGGLTVQTPSVSVIVPPTASRHLAPKMAITSPSPQSSMETSPTSSESSTPSPVPPPQLTQVSSSPSSPSSSSFSFSSSSSRGNLPPSKTLRLSPPPLIHVQEADASDRPHQQLCSSPTPRVATSPTSTSSCAKLSPVLSSTVSSLATVVPLSLSVQSPSPASASLTQVSVSPLGDCHSPLSQESSGHIPELVPVNPPLSSLLAPPEVVSSSSSLTEDPLPFLPLKQGNESMENKHEQGMLSTSSGQEYPHQHKKRKLELNEDISDQSSFPSTNKKPRPESNWVGGEKRESTRTVQSSRHCALRQRIQRPMYFRELYDYLYEPASFQKPVKTPGATKGKRGRRKKSRSLHPSHLISSPPPAQTSPSLSPPSSLTSSSPSLLLPSPDMANSHNKASLRAKPPSLLEHETSIESVPCGPKPTSKSSESLFSSLFLPSSTKELAMEEKVFGELLLMFMQLQGTPITRIPLLGSKRLNLYELFKVTTRLGGYEKVTSERKWSAVFDILCGTEMTCASTVTRKHYEKFLLPFERALAATKRGDVQTPLVQQNATLLASTLLSNSMPPVKAPIATD